jgi:hypothetical protein
VPLVLKDYQQACNGYIQGLANPSFESGFASWATAGTPSLSTWAVHGTYSMRMGNRNNAEDAIGQAAQVPNWAETAAVYFYAYMQSSDSTVYPYDYFAAVVFDSSDNIIASGLIWNTSTRNSWQGWKLPISNIAAYRNQPLFVMFAGFTDSSFPTTWYVDNAGLVFACGSTIAGSSSVTDDTAFPLAELEAVAIDDSLADKLHEAWRRTRP